MSDAKKTAAVDCAPFAGRKDEAATRTEVHYRRKVLATIDALAQGEKEGT